MCLPVLFVGIGFFLSLCSDRKELNDYDQKKIEEKKAREAAKQREIENYLNFERSYNRRRRGDE